MCFEEKQKSKQMNCTIEQLFQQYEEKNHAIMVDFKSLVPEIVKPERYTHLIHPYPAKLLASIPYYILRTERFCPNGGVVLDPFCGAGTVLLEAILCGKNALGADANPIARLISEAKTQYVPANDLKIELDRILRKIEKNSNCIIPDFPNKDFWFSRHVQEQLSHLLHIIQKLKDKKHKVFFMVCFSNIIKKVSYADPRIYVPVRMNPERFTDKPDLYQKLRIKLDSLRNIDVYEKFRQVSMENIQRMELLRELADSRCTSRVISKDARNLTNRIGSKELLEDESVDLVLTSPPYAGAQKYIRSSRLSLNWFGMGNPDSIRNLEKSNIGREDLAQKDRIISEIGIGEVDKLIAKIALKDTTRACIVSTYLNEMSVALKEAVRVLKKGGYMVLVVGPNKVSGYDFDTPKYLRLIAERYGMHTELLLIDSIKKYGMLTMRNKTAGMIMVEHVIVMKK